MLSDLFFRRRHQAPIERQALATEQKASLAAHLTLATSRDFGLDVGYGLGGAIRRHDVEGAAPNGKRLEAHRHELIEQRRNSALAADHLALEARRGGLKARRVKVKYRTIQHEPGNGRAERRIAVRIKDAATEGEIGCHAQARGPCDHVQVAW